MEGLAISLESGTWDGLPLRRPAAGALPAQKGPDGKLVYRRLSVQHPGVWGPVRRGGPCPALLGATVCTSGAAFALSFALPGAPAPPPPPGGDPARRRRPWAALLRSRRAWLLMGLLAALSLGRLLVNFFYAERLQACGLSELWMTPLILGYSCIQMLAAPILGRLAPPGAGGGPVLRGGRRGDGPAGGQWGRWRWALPLMLALPLLLAVPGCILSLWQKRPDRPAGPEAHRAEALSAFHMASSLFELVFLTGSSAIAALGPAACFGAVGGCCWRRWGPPPGGERNKTRGL